MPVSRCPGQDRRYWSSEDVLDVPCPNCGQSLEFWKTEARRRCTACGRNVLNPKLDLGCAKWCQFARDCLGMSVDDARDESLCQDLIREMTQALGSDTERVRRALRVLDFAERILQEEQADPLVVKAAAVLLEVAAGARAAPGPAPAATAVATADTTAIGQASGPPLVCAILARFRIDAARADSICRVVDVCARGGAEDTVEFRVVRDAVHLADMQEARNGTQADTSGTSAGETFCTKAGQALSMRPLPEKKGPA